MGSTDPDASARHCTYIGGYATTNYAKSLVTFYPPTSLLLIDNYVTGT